MKSHHIHAPGYQDRDLEVLNYQMYQLPGTRLSFRGPPPELRPNNYIAFVGAAQTFGCLCENPFVNLIQATTQIPSLNLGYGGAGPSFFTAQEGISRYLNEAKLVVVQIMSARSVSNSCFESHGLEYLERRSDGQRLSAQKSYQQLVKDHVRRQALWRRPFTILRSTFSSIPEIEKLVVETQERWCHEMVTLLDSIKVPKLLFWFSTRTPRYTPFYLHARLIFGSFPQLVNEKMIERIKPSADGYLECVTRRGIPYTVKSRWNNKIVQIDPRRDRPDLGVNLLGIPWTHRYQTYYPSPQMHEDAAATLLPALKRMAL